jgi:hypothetical protein
MLTRLRTRFWLFKAYLKVIIVWIAWKLRGGKDDHY